MTDSKSSINSFGFGGANAHCIIESYEPKSSIAVPITNGPETNGIYANETITKGSILNGSTHAANGAISNSDIPIAQTLIPFVFSATSVKSLVSLLDSLREFLERNPEVCLPSLAYTLSTRRSALSLRGSIYASSAEKLRQRIVERLGTDVADSYTSHSVAALSAPPSILGIFTGQGAQWPAMGSKLVAAIPMAHEILSSLDASLASLPAYHRPSWTLAGALSPNSKHNVSEAAISQPLCTAVQIVLVDLLRAAGVRFRAVVGHSSGEIAAAYAAGFLSASDAIRIAYYRGYFAKLAAGPGGEKGGMIAAGTSFEDAYDLCQAEDLVERLRVAAHNSPTSVTLSGDVDAVNLAKDVFEEEKKFARALRVDTAYHSAHMQRCSPPYLKALSELDIHSLQPDYDAPQWFSSMYNSKVTVDTKGLDSQYWVDNMVRPVLFYPAIKTCLESVTQGFNFSVEVGPHPALQGPVKESILALTSQDIAYSGTLQRGSDDVEAFADALGKIWARFGPAYVDLGRFQQTCRPDIKVKALEGLPAYPWTHEVEYWAESRKSKVYNHQPGAFHDLLGLREPDSLADELRWRQSLNENDTKWLSGHKLQGQVVFPATGYICMIAEAALLMAQGLQVASIDILDLEIRKAIVLHQDQGTEAIFSLTKVFPAVPDVSTEVMTADFKIFSVAGRDSTQMALNCCGSVRVSLGTDYASRFPVRRLPVPSMVPVDVNRFYQVMKEEVGLGFDGAFRSLTSLLRRAGYGTATARNPPFSETETKLLFHPAMLDCGLQALYVALAAPGDGSLSELVAPTYFRRITLIPELLRQNITDEVAIDSTITDTHGMTQLGDVEVYTSGFEHKLIEMEGIKISPIVPPTAENDRFLFQESVMCPDKLDAQFARGDMRLSPEEVTRCYAAERVAFYYLRQLVLTITPEVRAKLPRYRQCLLEEAERLLHQVRDEKHRFASPWINDTKETILDILDK
jgi:acyl transferase domain-containing protein